MCQAARRGSDLTFAFALLAALALTLIVELLVAIAFGLRSRRGLLAVLLINVLTNPLLNVSAALVGLVSRAAYTPYVAGAEVAVVLVEWRLLLWLLGGASRPRLLLSLAMNAASASIGLLFWFV